MSTLRSMAASPSFPLRSLISWAPSLIRLPRDGRGLRGERRGDQGWGISLRGWRRRVALIGDFWGFLTTATGLNNQRGGKIYCSEVQESFLGIF
jgi:hypothetical protein